MDIYNLASQIVRAYPWQPLEREGCTISTYSQLWLKLSRLRLLGQPNKTVPTMYVSCLALMPPAWLSWIWGWSNHRSRVRRTRLGGGGMSEMSDASEALEEGEDGLEFSESI